MRHVPRRGTALYSSRVNFLPGLLSITGLNYTFWVLMGLLRYFGERIRSDARRALPRVDNRASLRWKILAATSGMGISIALLALSIALVAADRNPSAQSTILPWQWPVNANEKTLLAVCWLGWPLLASYATQRLLRGTGSLTSISIAAVYITASIPLTRILLDRFEPIALEESALAFFLVLFSALVGASIAEEEHRWVSRVRMIASRPPPPQRITPRDVAVIMAAHNEEAMIGKTLSALMKIISPGNLFLGSDASTDRTVEIARSFGVHISDLSPNRGKARVLRYLLDTFKLCERFKAILILDADIVVHPDYLTRVLPHFDDPRVAAVPGRSIPLWQPRRGLHQSLFVTAYRIRLWRMLQFGLRYGQTWRYTNMSTIIPGAMSVYRSSILRQLHVDAPGLVIEDYNMTFEVHHRRLGRIAYDTRALISAKQPLTVKDYIRQVRRWYLGWWQTLRRHGFWPSAFWFFTASFTAEMILNGIFLLAVPILAVVLVVNGFQPIPTWELHGVFIRRGLFSLGDILLGVLLIDYLTTVVVTMIERKPLLLLYGLGFFLFRFIDAFLFIVTIPLSFVARSDGRWVSPKRTEATST